jgi:hypothetical protein
LTTRNFITHTVSTTQPAILKVGDEWYDPSANKLYKGLVNSGNAPRWTEIVQSLSTVGEAVKLVSTSPNASSIVTANVSIANVNVLESGIWYFGGNTTGNWTTNIQGNATTKLDSITTVGQAVTVVVMAVNGSTAYYPNQLQIDGVNTGVRWQSSTVTSGNANSLDSYSYTLIKVAAGQFAVLASQTKFA